MITRRLGSGDCLILDQFVKIFDPAADSHSIHYKHALQLMWNRADFFDQGTFSLLNADRPSKEFGLVETLSAAEEQLFQIKQYRSQPLFLA